MTSPDESIDSLMLKPLGKHFHILKLLGQGNFGRTFLAVDESQPEKPQCAFKQFFPQGLGNTNGGEAAELFRHIAITLVSNQPTNKPILNPFVD